MPKSTNQKKKILYILKCLMEKTDDEHEITTPQIIEYLASNDIKADRKTIYTDIETLNEFGLDIMRNPGPRGGYYLADRDFELAEVKILVDLVQSSKFITENKSRELIGKLKGLVSVYQARSLSRQLVSSFRSKSVNESIYYSVDCIYEAMQKNVKIKFNYFEWNVKKEKVFRHDGKDYIVSPWHLTWDDENYYLIAFDDEEGKTKHYRVDKMEKIQVTDLARTGKDYADKITQKDILSTVTFGMFGGDEKDIKLICENSKIGVMVDRFGKDVHLRPFDQNHAMVSARVQVSPQFYGWVFGFDGKVRIDYPEEVVAGYKKYLQREMELYM